MKAEQRVTQFQPVQLTLESQEEVDAVFAALNYAPMRIALGLPVGIAGVLTGYINRERTNNLHHAICAACEPKS